MGTADDKFDLDFTVHFSNAAVEAEKLPADVPAAALAKQAQGGKTPPVAGKPAADKVVLDPEFRIGASKLETDGYFVAVARRSAGTVDLSAGCKVMFVEDEPVTNAVLKKVLTSDGFEAYGALDSAGLGALLKQHGIPDLIMLDIDLPKVSGLQILARIRKHPKIRAIPALILTSHADMSDVVRGLSLGANGYLTKPVTVETLRSVLRQVLGGLPAK